MKEEIYIKEPYDYIDSIPVFCDLNNDYVKNYEKIAENHIKAIKKGIENPFIDRNLWNEMENSTLNLINKYLEKIETDSIKVLDVGVGLGRILEKLKSTNPEKHLELYGCDISISYLSLSKSKGIEVACCNVEDMPYKDEFFDIVVCTDVLEHVLDLNRVLYQIKRVLRRGGYLFVRVPNREDLSQYLKSDYPYYFVHLRTFDRYSLELLFSRVVGMKCIEISDGTFIELKNMCKYLLPIKGYFFILLKLLRIVKLFSKEAWLKLTKKLFHPIEINGVFSK